MAECTFRRQVGQDETWECLACHASWVVLKGGPKEYDLHYCPNCGAKITKLERTISNAEDDVTTIVSEDYK